MLTDGKDRGIYYITNVADSKKDSNQKIEDRISNQHSHQATKDDTMIKLYSKHRFKDMDTLFEYGYTLPEVRQVQHAVLDNLKDGVPVISKENLRKELNK